MSLSKKAFGKLQLDVTNLACRIQLDERDLHIRELIECGKYLDAILACRQALMRERTSPPKQLATDRMLQHRRLDELRLLLDTLNSVRVELGSTSRSGSGSISADH